jgi:predicted dienelactone hydrolase
MNKILKYAIIATVSVAAMCGSAQAAGMIGFKEANLPDADGDRPLHVSIWYPTNDAATATQVGENKVFFGVPAITNAMPENITHPLVVLSHGYSGSWRNLGWLAAELVQKGYVVAAPDHPGTTSFDRSATQAANLWERPHDLSRVIDALLADQALAGTIEPTRIAAIGHSLGGWTVTALGGARFNTEKSAQDCKIGAGPQACTLSAELGIVSGVTSKLDADLRDKRISAIVSLDLGLARGFTPESLAAFPVPALVINAGVDMVDMPIKQESAYLAATLPAATSQMHEITDATHYSFMQVCKEGAVALIEEDEPGWGKVCKDGGTRSRDAIHHEVTEMVTAFLANAIPRK